MDALLVWLIYMTFALGTTALGIGTFCIQLPKQVSFTKMRMKHKAFGRSQTEEIRTAAPFLFTPQMDVS